MEPAAVAAPFYVAGGTLPPETPSYVTRRADQEIHDRLLAGEFCYVLTARQMGKSSLIVRALTRLRGSGVATAMVDLTRIGKERGTAKSNDWYYGLAYDIHRQLRIERPLLPWWQERGGLPSLQRLEIFLREMVLGTCTGHIVIVVDEIDLTIGLPFADDFFAAIRATYNARAIEPAFGRLTFALLGVASPDQLIRDPSRTPFNIGRRIELGDFTADEAGVLASGLHRDAEVAAALLQRVLHWTGGQPYLTQAVCRGIADRGVAGAPPEYIVDGLIEETFLTARSQREESNLNYARARLIAQDVSAGRRPLRVYLRVRSGRAVPDEPRSPAFVQLKLSGLVKVSDEGRLVVRNRIYEAVFTADWARSHLARGWRWQVAAAALATLGALGTGLIWYQTTALRDQREAARTGVALNLVAVKDLLEAGRVEESGRLLRQALELARQTGDVRSEAAALDNLGALEASGHNFAEARVSFGMAEVLYRRIGDRAGAARVLLGQGGAYNSMNQAENAIGAFTAALSYSKALLNRQLEAESRLGLAWALDAQGRLEQAEAMRRVCRELVVQSLKEATSDSRQRLAFARMWRETSDLEIELLMAQHRAQPSAGFDRRAWLVSERDRVPGLVSAALRGLQSWGDKQGKPGGLVGELNDATAKRLRLGIFAASSKLEERIDTLASEYEALTAESNQPVTMMPPSVNDLQGALPHDSMLLEFHLGARHSFLWAVTADGVRAFEQPARHEIERWSTPAISFARAAVEGGQPNPFALELSTLELSRRLLGQAPLTRSRLLIVTDGILSRLPFGALPDPNGKGEPLILRHDIVNLPSLRWLLIVRQAARRRKVDGSIAIVAPVILQRDLPGESGLRGSTESSLPWLPRFPGLDLEVDKISSLVGRDRHSLVAIGFDASRELLMSGRLRPFSILHFGTSMSHDRRHPELSYLLLSHIDRAAQPRDGWVRAYEIPSLNLTASLVVLSGDSTVVGGDSNGLGDTMGLSEHFLAQGVPQVIGSLRPPEDLSTADFMESFYRHLLRDRQPPARALAEAQRDLWRSASRRFFHYASAFVLQGMPDMDQ